MLRRKLSCRPYSRSIQRQSYRRHLALEILENREVLAAPILDASASPSFGSVLEDAPDPSEMTIAAIVTDGSITDPDGTALEAIAITSLNTNLGNWQYRLEGSSTWLTINASLINSQTNELALLLGPTAQLRLLPFVDLNGSLSDGITFRAWDMSNGSQGQYVILSNTGGNTAFSTERDTVRVSVSKSNDPPTFRAGAGKVVTDLGSTSDIAYSVAVQPDGKIIIAGLTNNSDNTDIALVRYLPNGSLDLDFGNGGKVTVGFGMSYDHGQSLALQPDGKIVVAGYKVEGIHSDFVLLRFDVNGTLDSTFGTNGKVITDFGTGNDEGQSVTIQPDGKIVVAGYNSSDFALARYLSDGSLDLGFGTSGKVTTDFGSSDEAYGVTMQSDGKILLAGRRYGTGGKGIALARYHADGSLDTSFGVGGLVTTSVGTVGDAAYSIALQSDGKIVVGGRSHNGTANDFVLLRYSTDGVLDPQFGTEGKVITDIAQDSDIGFSLAIQRDGKILLGGSIYNGNASEMAIVRYHADGTLDSAFGNSGKVITSIGANGSQAWGISVQLDGKILLVGSSSSGMNSDIALVRYKENGSLDTRFASPKNTLGDTVLYTEGSSPVILDDNVSVFDAELSSANDFSGAVLTLERSLGANSQDLFSATGTLGVLVQGHGLVVSGNTIGNVTTNSGGRLILTFNHQATGALVDATMRQIAYSNASSNPPDSVEIRWIFNDVNDGSQGSGGIMSVADSVIVNITNRNDAPIANPDTFIVKKNSSQLLDVLGNDVDLDGTLNPASVVIKNSPFGGTATAQANGKILFAPTPGFVGNASFRYAVSDNEGKESNSAEVTVQVVESPYQNPKNKYDVDDDQYVSPLDVLVVVNLINAKGPSLPVDGLPGPPNYVDVNGDNRVDPLDALEVINYINLRDFGTGEGEAVLPNLLRYQVNQVNARLQTRHAPMESSGTREGLLAPSSHKDRLCRLDGGLSVSQNRPQEGAYLTSGEQSTADTERELDEDACSMEKIPGYEGLIDQAVLELFAQRKR